MNSEKLPNLYPNELSQKEKIRFYSQEIFEDQSSMKFYFLIIGLILVVVDKVGDLVVVPDITKQKGGFQPIHILFLLSAFVVYTLSFTIPALRRKNCSSGFNLRLFLNFIATCLLTIFIISENTSSIEDAMRENTILNWDFALEDYSCSICLTLLVSLFLPTWHLKVILPCGYFVSMIYAYFRMDHMLKYWILARLGTNMIIIIVLTLLQSRHRWKHFLKNLETEGWNQIYQDILSRTPSAIGVLNLEDDIVYANTELRALLIKKNQDSNQLFKDLIKIRKRHHWMKRLTNSRDFPNEGSSSSRHEEKPHLHHHPEDAFLSPTHNEESYLNRLSPRMGPQDSEDRIRKTSGEVTPRIFFEKTEEYDNFSDLLRAFRVMSESSKDRTDEKHLVYDGKLLLDQSVFVQSKKVTVSYEIRLCPLYEHKKLIFILNNTTERDMMASVEESSQYKDRLLASLSHNLRTPLNGNLTFLQSAINDSKVDFSIKEKVLVPAIRSGTLLMNLINDILDYSLLQSNEFSLHIEMKSLQVTLKNAYNLLKDTIVSKSLDCKLEIDERIGHKFNTDHHRVTQIVLNLLGNAMKFTYEGSIVLKAQLKEESKVEISVEDTGIGMSKSELDDVKNEMTSQISTSSTPQKSKGIGLGLKISNDLVKKLSFPEVEEGLVIKSTQGRGSRFSFVITNFKGLDLNSSIQYPFASDGQLEKHLLASEEEGNTSQDFSAIIETLNETDKKYNNFTQAYGIFNKNSHIIYPPNREKLLSLIISGKLKSLASKVQSEIGEVQEEILVVDDDPMNILGLELLLKKLKFSVSKAYNGQQAIEKVIEKTSLNGFQFRAIFMDCQMPVMDGYQATRALRDLMRDGKIPIMPIIGCTAFTAKNKLDECIASGMDYVITKPVSFERLHEMLVSK